MIRNTLFVALAFVAVPLFAQDNEMAMPKPSPSMAKFEPLLGSWVGEGLYRQDADSQAMPWSATMQISRILDGYAVQEDLAIEVGAPTKLVMRTVYGVDSGTGNAIAFAVSNMGTARSFDWEFTQDGVLILLGMSRTANGAEVTRTRIEFTKDRYSSSSDCCLGDGKVFTGVEGKMKRGDAPAQKGEVSAFVGTNVNAAMTALSSMAGAWNVVGSMVMAPGTPKMDIKGVETNTKLFGGHVILSSVVGEAANGMPPYLAHNYLVWNDEAKHYEYVSFDSMGMVMQQTGVFTEPQKTMVVTGAVMWMGEPSVQSTKITFGQKGIESVVSHAISGAKAPYECFTSTYTKASGVK